jgi:hypothetical protein
MKMPEGLTEKHLPVATNDGHDMAEQQTALDLKSTSRANRRLRFKSAQKEDDRLKTGAPNG